MSRPEPVRRRDTQKEASGRRIVFASGFALALAALSFGLWQEASDPRFAVNLTHVSGIVHTSAADVQRAAALPAVQNAWLIDRHAVARRIEALPWVGKAALHVSWPNQLVIDITERRAVARVALMPAGGEEEPVPRFALVDESQRVLEVSEDPNGDPQLPRLVVTPPVVGDTAPGTSLTSAAVTQALSALQQLRALGLSVSEVAIAPSTGISATVDRNLRVLFGEDEDLAKKARLFQAILAEISTPERVAYVDVRSVRAPTVLYR